MSNSSPTEQLLHQAYFSDTLWKTRPIAASISSIFSPDYDDFVRSTFPSIYWESRRRHFKIAVKANAQKLCTSISILKNSINSKSRETYIDLDQKRTSYVLFSGLILYFRQFTCHIESGFSHILTHYFYIYFCLRFFIFYFKPQVFFCCHQPTLHVTCMTFFYIQSLRGIFPLHLLAK